MKTFLTLLSLAGLLALATTGCTVQERGGYYGPSEYSVEVYGHPYYHHDGYWDRGHYYRY